MPESGSDPLFQGFVLMVVGMAMVFAFLTLMVFAIQLAAKVIARFAPAPAPAIPPVEHSSVDNNVRVAVMLAAVRHSQKAKV